MLGSAEPGGLRRGERWVDIRKFTPKRAAARDVAEQRQSVAASGS